MCLGFLEIQSFDNRDDAEVLESQLVAKINPRCNRSPDGKCGSHYRTEKQRKELSESMKGKTGVKNPMYGKKHTPETRQKMSDKRKGRKGKTPTPETRQKISNTKKHPVWEFADHIIRLKQQGWTYRKLSLYYGCGRKPLENILKAYNKDQTK